MAVNFFTNGLCFYCYLAKCELMEYRDFHARTEWSWRQQDEELQAQIQDLLQRYPDADKEQIVDSYGWELHLNSSRYPDIHRNSLVVALYIFLEQQLNGLCETLSECLDTPVSVKDLTGHGVERALLFFRKVAIFDLGRVSSLSFIRNVNKLRNRLVHAGGLLPSAQNEKVNQFVTTTPGLRGKPGAYVKVNPEFIDHLIECLMMFFEELDEQVQIFIQNFQQDAPSGR